MQICEYFFENACYSVTKYYLCKQNNKRSLLGRKQRHQVVRSFPNRYLFSLTNKVTCLFPISCILEIILMCKRASFTRVFVNFCFSDSYKARNKRKSVFFRFGVNKKCKDFVKYAIRWFCAWESRWAHGLMAVQAECYRYGFMGREVYELGTKGIGFGRWRLRFEAKFLYFYSVIF